MTWIKIEIVQLFPYFSAQVPLASNSTFSNICFERPPSILVPLKVHSPPKGYQLYMTCAVRGCPTPSVSWYLNDVCINSDKNYYITNSYGVCSMYILRVRPMDNGEYKVVALNSLGQAECSTKLIVRGKHVWRELNLGIRYEMFFTQCFVFSAFLFHRLKFRSSQNQIIKLWFICKSYPVMKYNNME